MARRRKRNDSDNILRFYESGEDDGSRNYNDAGEVLCNRCGAVMDPKEDMDVNCAYYECPECGFIEIEEFYDDYDPTELGTFDGAGWDLW